MLQRSGRLRRLRMQMLLRMQVLVRDRLRLRRLATCAAEEPGVVSAAVDRTEA